MQHFLTFSLLIVTLATSQANTEQWLKLSILSQNAGQSVHALGVDSGDDTAQIKAFAKAIDTELNKLVADGTLESDTFTLKPALDIEESVALAVASLIKKHAAQYGVFTLREMMDLGARQHLTVFDDKTPVTLKVRLPKEILAEFRSILKSQKLQN